VHANYTWAQAASLADGYLRLLLGP